jgi:hypothetical protein
MLGKVAQLVSLPEFPQIAQLLIIAPRALLVMVAGGVPRRGLACRGLPPDHSVCHVAMAEIVLGAHNSVL